MERLMNDSNGPYIKNPDFNPRFVTKLVENYRSDKRLLKLPNELFYDNELIPMATGNKKLKEKVLNKFSCNFPILFYNVVGRTKRPRGSMSLFNDTEGKFVQKLVKKLLKTSIGQKSIGIISPYRAQYLQIQSRIHYCDRVQVGSPELFQGQEKEVIIISTVRSRYDKSKSLEFISDPKRYNVAITRAKSIVIFVGDESVLQKNYLWNTLLDYIKHNGGYYDISDTSTDINGNNVDKIEKSLAKLSI